ncbi:MAG: bacteriohemerythrin [Bacteriovorax sp.]|nr:bacteriohemerythrin [Bacteriovorax sp.]
MNLILWSLATVSFSLSLISFNFMKKSRKISEALDNLADISFDLSGSAEQVGTVSHDLQEASLEQLDTLGTTMSTSHEINAMMNRTSDNTNSLSNEANLLQEVTARGSGIVEEMVHVSLEIKEGSEHFKSEMQKSMNELSQSLETIKQISDKTKLINDIVFQTKLLSFNASVEAARAGEAGKGFSVVAEEIGKLAQMSGRTADEISKIVEQSTTSVGKAIISAKDRVEKLTLESAKKNDLGYQSTKNCEVVFKEISEKISEIHRSIEEINIATKEQAIGVNQLDITIIKLQEVGDRNGLVASQSTEHAHELVKQTQNLAELYRSCSTLNNQKGHLKPRFQKFIWNDRLALGVKSMDAEHVILIEKINNLVTQMEQQYGKKDTESLYQCFSDLAKFTVEHFSHEEDYMRSIGYMQLTSHHKIHEKLLNHVGTYGVQIKNGTIDSQKLISFLRNWLLSHIMGVDMQYAEYSRSVPVPARKKIA